MLLDQKESPQNDLLPCYVRSDQYSQWGTIMSMWVKEQLPDALMYIKHIWWSAGTHGTFSFDSVLLESVIFENFATLKGIFDSSWIISHVLILSVSLSLPFLHPFLPPSLLPIFFLALELFESQNNAKNGIS